MPWSSSSSGSTATCTPRAGILRSGDASSAAVWAWLAAALLLFLLETLPYLSYRWVPDESWYAGPGYSLAHGHGIADPAIGPNDLENRFDARPPGTALMIAAAFRLFGAGQISARLGSVLAGCLIVLFTYFLSRDVIGRAAALVATFLVATDNLVVLTARTARPEALATLAVLASLLAIERYSQKGSVRWAFLSGLLMALGTLFHITVAGFVFSLGILALVIGYSRKASSAKGAAAYGLAYISGLLPFAAWISTAPWGRAGFAEEYLHRAAGGPVWERFLNEGQRYSDLLGLNMLHGHGLDPVPVRLPILLFVLCASFLLWKLRRRWFYMELLLLFPSMLWFAYTVNKTSRYLAMLAPVLALAIGAAVVAVSHKPRLQRVLLVMAGLAVIAQASANFMLLSRARQANYNKVAEELRRAIPANQTAYGTITFWMALHDRPFISYERTDPWMAADRFHARYFIAGDRVMMNGLPGDEEFYARLRQSMGEVAAHSELVAAFKDSYYGDIRVYKLTEPVAAAVASGR